MLRKVGGARLPKQLRLLSVGAVGIRRVDPVHVLDDRETGGAQSIGKQKCAGVGPMERDARSRELMMMIGRKCASHDSAGRRQVNGELARDGRMLDVGDPLRRKQTCKDVAVVRLR